MSYYTRIGDVSSRKKPKRASFERFSNWYNQFKQVENLNDYDVYLIGSFPEFYYGESTYKPYDIDIVLVGEIKDKTILKNILDTAARLGYENELIIDIFHNNKLANYNDFEVIYQTRSFNNFYVEFTFKKEKHITDYCLNGKDIGCGLFTRKVTIESKSIVKALHRVHSSDYSLGVIKFNDVYKNKKYLNGINKES